MDANIQEFPRGPEFQADQHGPFINFLGSRLVSTRHPWRGEFSVTVEFSSASVGVGREGPFRHVLGTEFRGPRWKYPNEIGRMCITEYLRRVSGYGVPRAARHPKGPFAGKRFKRPPENNLVRVCTPCQFAAE